MPFPEIDGGRRGLPDLRLFDSGKARKRAVFGAEGHIIVGLSHHRRLAGNRISQHAEAVLGADHEGVEAVEIVERMFQCIAEAVALADAPSEIAGGNFRVVVRLEREAMALELATKR